MENVIENIKSRRSIRKYKEEQIKDEELFTILDSANMHQVEVTLKHGNLL